MKKHLSILAATLIIFAIAFQLFKPSEVLPNAVDQKLVEQIVANLSSDTYFGRKAGTKENEMALDYIESQFSALGLSSYRQSFEALIPETENESNFSFFDPVLQEEKILKHHIDYKMLSWGPAGSLNYQGDIVFTDNNVYKVDPAQLKGKLVVTQGTPYIGDSLEQIINAGAVGVLYYLGNNETDVIANKNLDLGDKTGDQFALGFISRDLYFQFKQIANQNKIISNEILPSGTIHGLISGVNFNHPITFNPISTENMYFTFDQDEGTLKDYFNSHNGETFVVLQASIDHVGGLREPIEERFFYPGAAHSAIGVGLLLDAANTLNDKDSNANIIFAITNADDTGMQGINQMMKDFAPVLENTLFVSLLDIGGVGSSTTYLGGVGDGNDIFLSKVVALGSKEAIPTLSYRTALSTTNPDISLVLVSQDNKNAYTVLDEANSINYDSVNNVSRLIYKWLGTTYYKYNAFSGIPIFFRSLFIAILFILLINFILESYKEDYLILKRISISRAFLLEKWLLSLLTALVIIVLMIFVTMLPRDLNYGVYGGRLTTNFSFEVMIQQMGDFILNFKFSGVKDTAFVLRTFKNSLILLFVASLLAFVLGSLKGLFDAYSNKENTEVRSFTSLVVMSVPDIIWILISHLIIIAVGKQIELPILRQLVFPILTLTIMPMVYLSRIAYLGFIEEKGKPYYTALLSRGIKKKSIFFSHMIVPALQKVFTSFLGILPLMISNMIIIEYLFDYKGLANFVLIADRTQDQNTFIVLLIGISVLYLIFAWVTKLGIYSLTARRRRR
ncbi:MAG: hypothetical protein BGO41_12450 [Clostridiales bacterium 38-18]|nr:MAG: hypothetical protein BGO41_12450 [Clostridiales bacterium 38-18]